MPFTYFAHQIFVLPLKQAKPRWFDGTALCIGSMAPDFAYAILHTPLQLASHRFRAQLYWTLPVTWALTWLVRQHLAAPLGAQLPAPLGPQVQALARTRHPYHVTAWSAVLGGLSHVVVDAFTHPHGWAFERFALLRQLVFGSVRVADGLQYLGHTLGTGMGVWWLWRMVQTRRISAWNGSQASAAVSDFAPAPWFWPALLRGSGLCALGGLFSLLTTRDISVSIMRGSALELLLLVGLAFALRRDASVSIAE